MSHLMIRVAALAGALAFMASGIARAADASPAQRAEIATLSNQFVSAVVSGDAKTLHTLTTPDFTLTSLEGQTITADDLAAKWKIMMIEYGGETSNVRVGPITVSDGTITSVIAIHTMADTFATGDGVMTTSLDAMHKLTWLPTSDGWKIASDVVLRRMLLY